MDFEVEYLASEQVSHSLCKNSRNVDETYDKLLNNIDVKKKPMI